jgi:polyisoprenoid-binding protein YceI
MLATRLTPLLCVVFFTLGGLGLVGCAPTIQRAALTDTFPHVKMEPRSQVGEREAPPRKLAFRSPHARVHVFSNDLLNGDHHLHFSPIRGSYVIDRASNRGNLHVEIGMTDLRAESGWITSFAGRMLAVDSHPRTIIDANVDPVPGDSKKREVTGNIRLRGVERGIRFRADVDEVQDGSGGVPGGVRFHASFDMSRSAFGIRAGPGEGDALIRDDFTVTIDFLATPERVKVEQVDDPPPRGAPASEYPRIDEVD